MVYLIFKFISAHLCTNYIYYIKKTSIDITQLHSISFITHNNIHSAVQSTKHAKRKKHNVHVERIKSVPDCGVCKRRKKISKENAQ